MRNTPKDTDLHHLARKIQAAEIFQILYFGSLTVLFALTTQGFMGPTVPAIITLTLMPLQIWASHQSGVLYGRIKRLSLAIAACVSLVLVGVYALYGIVGDYSWTSCGGCFLVHLVSMAGEHSDYQKKTDRGRFISPSGFAHIHTISDL